MRPREKETSTGDAGAQKLAPRSLNQTQASENPQHQHDARPVLMDYPALSGWLGIKIPTLRSMVSRRTIPSLRLGPRLVRFDRAEIERWIEACRIGGGQ